MPENQAHTVKTDLLRGFLGRCPNCGRGHLFRAFLKVADRCPVCGEELFHHRADDLPPYLVLVFVGHLMGATLLGVQAAEALSYGAEMAIFVPLTLALSIGLLQPTKGAVVALQWHLGMHGFATSRQAAGQSFPASAHAADKGVFEDETVRMASRLGSS